MQWKRQCFVLTLSVMAFGPAICASEVGDGDYRLPLAGDYAVWRNVYVEVELMGNGQYELAWTEPSNASYGDSRSTIVPDLEKVAVVGHLIVGKAKQGCFLLDSRQTSSEPTFFKSLDDLRSAVAAKTAVWDGQLSDPDTLAMAVPDRVLRPWNYRIMGGLLGFSDDLWSLLVQIVGLVIAFLYGFKTRTDCSLVWTAIALGILVNVVAQILIAGGGPGAFVGFCGFPLIYWLVAYLGRAVRILTGAR